MGQWTYVPDESEEILFATGHCEDYPCCGHTNDDPCLPQYYDRPGYYDTNIPGQEHNLCDHEFGECNVDDYADEDECEGDENCNCDSFGINHDAGWRARGCWTIFEGPLTEDGSMYA